MAEFSINALRVVHEVVRRGSFSAAATELRYTQSAVSRQVALAEAAAGCPLFDRHARGVQATEAGRLVARHAEAVLAELQATRQALEEVGTRPSGRLRVGAFSTALARLVPEAIATLAGREPHVEVSLREGTSSALLRRVAAKHIDLAIVTAPARPVAAVDVVDLMDDPL